MSKRTSTSQKGISLLIALAILVFGFAAFSGQVSPAYADTPPTPTVAPVQSDSAIPLIIPDTGYSGKVAAVQAYFVNTMAQQLGMSTPKFQNAYFAAARYTIQQALAAGVITDAQATAALSDIPDMYAYNMDLIYHQWDPFPWDKYFLNQKLFMPEDLVSALHTTGPSLIADLRAGKSAADIAKANNLDITVVEQDIMVNVSKRIADYSLFGMLSTGQQNATVLRYKDSLSYILSRRLSPVFFNTTNNSYDYLR
ncbi:MAG: hypothetical protein P4L50_25425 [Anaerolineaceae bacterium]|nr:hypothetical protein [Anaerolineaceae bacterium]